ncbi:MAG: hypothetical protein LUO91_03630 [Methanomicrobiales archaeon]|nr:hypothetical protein [Methanomicrobiales archaeon]
MPPRHRVLLLVGLLICCCILPGCLSFGIADVRYDGSRLSLRLTNSGEPRDAAIQVSAFRMKDLAQEEVSTDFHTLRLAGGEHEYTVPLALPPGSYKIYVYLIVDNDRKASVIQDITV